MFHSIQTYIHSPIHSFIHPSTHTHTHTQIHMYTKHIQAFVSRNYLHSSSHYSFIQSFLFIHFVHVSFTRKFNCSFILFVFCLFVLCACLLVYVTHTHTRFTVIFGVDGGKRNSSSVGSMSCKELINCWTASQ